MKPLPFPILLFTVIVLSASLTACAAPAPIATATLTPSPIPSRTPTETPTPTATANAEATKQAEFETKKAEALKMVSIKLDSPEDLAALPVLDDVADFDSGKVQEVEHWLIDNVLPPADIKLPDSWRIGENPATGFRWMEYNRMEEADVVTYRGVSAFFVIRDGVKMLRLGVEYGGPGQLIHFNLEDPRWWTDPVWIKALIAAYNRNGQIIIPVVSFGTEIGFAPEVYNKKVYSERPGGDQFFTDWVQNRQLTAGADKTVFGMSTTKD